MSSRSANVGSVDASSPILISRCWYSSISIPVSSLVALRKRALLSFIMTNPFNS